MEQVTGIGGPFLRTRAAEGYPVELWEPQGDAL
jgi:hypothetical protein